MRRSLTVLLTACLVLTAAPACGPTPDLHALKLTPTMTGYYVEDQSSAGENRMVPSVTFQLKNDGQLPINNVDLSIAFWPAGADGEKDSKQIRGIAGEALEPGATGETLTVRSSVGFASFNPLERFFVNGSFVDYIAKIFAKRNGKTVKLAEVTVERRLLPAARKDGTRP